MLSVYCSGSIKKSSDDNKRMCWTDEERRQVQAGAVEQVVFLNPDDPIVDATDWLGQFGRDMYQVWFASAVIVDARERRGLGIGVEIAAANAMGTPVIVVAPPEGQYRMPKLEYRGVTVANYVHPHLASLAASIVDTFEDAGRLLSEVRSAQDEGGRRRPEWLVPALAAYERLLPLDAPMLAAMDQMNLGR